jgi:hypothetical protein
MLEKIFGRNKKNTLADPDINFGRYSDNNKSIDQLTKWKDAETLFRENKIFECFDAFFKYLKDSESDNVIHERNEKGGSFSIYQGSKVVKGKYDDKTLQAEVSLAHMVLPSVPVMRRLLEQNFHVYYSRYALDDERLCMLFDTMLNNASPAKLYYGLKELATRADKQDDLLVHDFTVLKMMETEHIIPLPENEKEVKFQYFQKWINELIELVSSLDMEKFSGGIAYLILATFFRIDFLLRPEGKLLQEMEKVIQIYFKKDEKPVVEKNRDMLAAIRKQQSKPTEEITTFLFNAKYAFAIVQPQPYKTISETISNANQNVNWYHDNGYPLIARQITEYGISYCQYAYSLPKPVTEFFLLFMMINHDDYFRALGFKNDYYKAAENKFDKEAIENRMEEIEKNWNPKYPRMGINKDRVRYNSLLQFNLSFTKELEELDMDPV